MILKIKTMLYLQTIIFEYTCPLRQVALLCVGMLMILENMPQISDVFYFLYDSFRSGFPKATHTGSWRTCLGLKDGRSIGPGCRAAIRGLIMAYPWLILFKKKTTLTYMPYPKPMHFFVALVLIMFVLKINGMV